MQLVTFSHPLRSGVGILRDGVITLAAWNLDLLSLIETGISPTETGLRFPLEECTLHAPLRPHKIVAVGRNYADHAAELGNAVPDKPLLFQKATSSLIGHGAAVTWSASFSQQIDWEGELAVVMGRRAQNVVAVDALKYVYGYTLANDISARDLQQSEPQWVRAKSLDTFCPLGPVLVTKGDVPDPHALTLVTTVNGEVMQNASTGLMLHRIDALIAYISQWMTLEAGDVILTGTPAGVGKGMTPPRFLADGDVVSVSIDGFGTLTNPCKVTA